MRHVRLRLALALALASRARAAPAPELMKVALAGSGHLQAYGVPYSDTHAHTLAGPTPLHFRPPPNLDLPIPSSSSAAGALRAAARAGVLLPAPGACNDYPVPFASCNFTCSVCQADPGGVTKVTCVDPGSGKVGLGENAVAATAIREAVSAVTLLLDVGPGHRDCACIQPVARVESANCTLLGSYCLYFPSASASASGFTPLLRAKVWDAASPKYIGVSKGWGEPADGYNATIPSAPYDSTLAAARAMRAANPARKCNPGKVTPLVLIPGLTSSAINYKLTSSTPPAWAFWCERTTDGWVPLWPLDTATVKDAFKFACWTANAQVTFDPATQAFHPRRNGEVTTTVDFGSPNGIPGFQGVASLYEISGWTLGKDLFFAPFDWRLPSASQQQFFNGLQALVEQVYTSLNGTKVALWAFSFGPQYTLSFLHRMTQAWKDKHIERFVATSPVWSGAPAALITYASGYSTGGAPAPHLPAQCKAFTAYAGTCYTGAAVAVANGTLADCCTATQAGNSSAHLFNYYAHNTTCHVMGSYIGTEQCSGLLGYDTPKEAAARPGHALQAKAASPLGRGRAGAGLGDVPLTPALTKVIARASPSLMWAFPRAGTANTTYTIEEPVLITKTKNYTAFDVEELLDDLGMGSVDVAQHQFLQGESDLAKFAAPGVDTVITYGTNTPTTSAAIYAKDFFSKAETNDPTGTLKEDGDGLVPTRGSLRGHEWAAAQVALGRDLKHWPYPLQPHAACFGGGGTDAAAKAGTECYTNVLSLLVHKPTAP